MTIFHSFYVLPIPVCHYNGINHLLFIAEHWKLPFFPFDLFVGQQVHNLSRCMDVCICCEFADSHKTSLVNYYLYQSCHYFYFMPKLNSTAVSSQSLLSALYCNCSNATHRCKASSLALKKQNIPKPHTASSFWNLGKVLKMYQQFPLATAAE